MTENSVKYTIMVVDDQPANLKLMEEMLGQQGYSVRSFPRGRLALAAAAQQRPDLILLDINMPAMNGFEVCTRLKADQRLASIPVIFLSALNETEDKVHGFRCGGIDYITKPFQFEEVRARVQMHVEMHRLRQALERQNEQLEKIVRDRTRDLEESRLEILQRLALAAEYRDDSTGQHIQRVGCASAVLAQELGLPDFECRLIGLAAPLHDIGKIGISDYVLLKPGKLTPEEFEIIKTHAMIGGKILSGSRSQILQVAESIALHHHERWDGTGYCAGLAGTSIPLPARIVAVADVFDALTHRRLYKPPWPVRDALAEIERHAGRRYDPAVVSALHQVVYSGALQLDGGSSDFAAFLGNVASGLLQTGNGSQFANGW